MLARSTAAHRLQQAPVTISLSNQATTSTSTTHSAALRRNTNAERSVYSSAVCRHVFWEQGRALRILHRSVQARQTAAPSLCPTRSADSTTSLPTVVYRNEYSSKTIATQSLTDVVCVLVWQWSATAAQAFDGSGSPPVPACNPDWYTH